jgi:RHS repeat-associated protein
VNALGQRKNLATSGTAFAASRSTTWGYDALGQVTSAATSDNSADRAYQYDAIGNRKKSASSLTLPTDDNYSANALNQYSSITDPQSAILNPQYDDDGNSTAYPLPANPSANSTLIWDAENRLTSATVNGVTTSYAYDAKSRRIAKTSTINNQQSAIYYLYDGWNLIADYAIQNSTSNIQHSYIWGSDLSGTLQDAGGVGGLLSVSQGGSTSFPAYDGNGNVSEYLGQSGAVAAHFEYDPFGNTVVNTDTAGLFNYRFSTKPLDAETGLYYYGYRFYDPVTGRWPSRDPIGERGGVNLNGFVGNDLLGRFDYLGFYGAFSPGIGDDGYIPGIDKPTPPTPTPSWPHDNLVKPPEINEYQQWLDNNFQDKIAIWKKLAISDISSKIDCSAKPSFVDGFEVLDGLGSNGGLYTIRLATEARVPVRWDGQKWSWHATLTAYNTFGSNGGNLLENLALPYFPGVEIPIGEWKIEDKGCCK